MSGHRLDPPACYAEVEVGFYTMQAARGDMIVRSMEDAPSARCAASGAASDRSGGAAGSMGGRAATFASGIAVLAILAFWPAGAFAQDAVVPEAKPSPERQIPARKPKAVSTDAPRARLYKTIIARIAPATVKGGRCDGMSFTRCYARAPKALAACIDWKTTTPTTINGNGAWWYQFVTRRSTTCAPTTEAAARSCAIAECNQYKGRSGCSYPCVLVDVNGRNVLQPPADWVQRHRR
jgi:hypothetical protein